MTNSSGLNGLTKFLMIVAIIGALNWGLIGFFNWNLVDAIFGGGAIAETSALSRVIYAIVGLAGIGALVLLPKTHTESVGRRHHLANRAV